MLVKLNIKRIHKAIKDKIDETFKDTPEVGKEDIFDCYKSDSHKKLQGFYENLNFHIVLDEYIENEGYEYIDDYNCYFEDTEFGIYGVADNLLQVLKQCPGLATSERYYVVGYCWMRKNEQDKNGGWRWHKWGKYIGNQKPTCEYLYDEPKIKEVVCYHIYELKRIVETPSIKK